MIKHSAKTIVQRRKNIIIEDVNRSKLVLLSNEKSKVLTCRNPFKSDDQVINYDLDTEDELAEEQGEDLDADQ